MILSLTPGGAQGYACSPPEPQASNMASKTEARQQPAVKASLAALASQSPSAKPDRGNAFLGNLSSYAPIYAYLVRARAVMAGSRSASNIKCSEIPGPSEVKTPTLQVSHYAYTNGIFGLLAREPSPFHK